LIFYHLIKDTQVRCLSFILRTWCLWCSRGEVMCEELGINVPMKLYHMVSVPGTKTRSVMVCRYIWYV